MASKIDLAGKYMGCMRERKLDEMVAMLADDVSMTSPMTGTVSGTALEQQMRSGPMSGGGGMGEITWSDPEEVGDDVKIVGTGSPFGPIKIVLSFNSDDLIKKIQAGLA